MKKFILILICLILLVGCKKKEEEIKVNNEDKEEVFILKKKDTNKDYIYFDKVREVNVDNNDYVLNNLVINIVSDEVDNVNLEIKSFINNSNRNYMVDNNKLVNGNVIDYEYYMNDKYLSVILKYYYYVRGQKGEENDKVYNIDLETGKVVNDEDLLKKFNLNEDKLYEELEKKIVSDDILYSLANIKNDGYQLYVNNDNKLGIIYSEVNDEEIIRKELILD